MPPLALRLLREGDLPFCDSLRQAVGWNQTQQDWLRFFQLSPEGCFLALWDGNPVGTVTTVRYNSAVGWIGMLIVHPAYRGRGIGAALLNRAIDHLRTLDTAGIALDATPQGEPLYASLGFKRDFAIQRWQSQNTHASIPSRSVRSLVESDLPSCVQLDETSFGIRRANLVQMMCASALRAVAFVEAGEIAGFATLRPGSRAAYLGPLVARDEAMAAALVSAATSQCEQMVFWDLPAQRTDELPRSFGFEVQRPLFRMWLGQKIVPQAGQTYWGLLDPSYG